MAVGVVVEEEEVVVVMVVEEEEDDDDDDPSPLGLYSYAEGPSEALSAATTLPAAASAANPDPARIWNL